MMKKENLKKWQLSTIIYGVIFYILFAFVINGSENLGEKLLSPNTLVATLIATLIFSAGIYTLRIKD